MLEEENKELRMLLAFFHNPNHVAGLYLDDGELQCSACIIDFKRDSVESIKHRINRPNKRPDEMGGVLIDA